MSCTNKNNMLGEGLGRWLSGQSAPCAGRRTRLGFPDPNECQVGVAACLLVHLQKTDSELPQSIQRDEPHQQPLGLIKRPCLSAAG